MSKDIPKKKQTVNQVEIGLKLKQVYLSKTGSFKFTMNGMQSKTFLAFFLKEFFLPSLSSKQMTQG